MFTLLQKFGRKIMLCHHINSLIGHNFLLSMVMNNWEYERFFKGVTNEVGLFFGVIEDSLEIQ